MIVTHHGNQCFKFQFGDMTVAVNPISKDSKLKPTRFGADICLISINHPDFNGKDQVSFGERQPFTITGPGEYEVKGVFIKGFPSVSAYEKGNYVNTIYTFNLDNINICFLGALNSKELPSEIKESIGEVDMLFVPVGGNGVLNAQDAYKLAVQLETKVIVPIGLDTGDKDALKILFKEGGAAAVKPVDKLTLKRKDLEGKEGEIMVLETS